MITSLRNAIDSKTSSLFSGRFFFTEIDKPIYPYGVFSELPSAKDYDSVDEYKDVYVQINSYGKDLDEIEVIQKTIEGLFDGKQAEFLLSDYYVISISLQFERTSSLPGKPDKVYMVTQQFKFSLEKK